MRHFAETSSKVIDVDPIESMAGSDDGECQHAALLLNVERQLCGNELERANVPDGSAATVRRQQERPLAGHHRRLANPFTRPASGECQVQGPSEQLLQELANGRYRHLPAFASQIRATAPSVLSRQSRAHQDGDINSSAARWHAGARQGSCRLIHAASGCLSSAVECAATTESRSGLRVTGPVGVQARVAPDHRAGLRSRALRYSAWRAARMA